MTGAASTSAVEPGLYQHYKGRLYRVLFVAPFWGHGTYGLLPDDLLFVCSGVDNIGVRLASDTAFMTAKWSGNGSELTSDGPVVIYVALYDEGRVAARPLKEFVENVDAAPGVREQRFKRIGP